MTAPKRPEVQHNADYVAPKHRSRYPAPGDDVPCWGDGGHLAVVIATSRHKQRLTLSEALYKLTEVLVNEVGGSTFAPGTPNRALAMHVAYDVVANETPYTWRSVTKREVEDESHCCGGDMECDEGSWCSEGAGRAWVEVVAGSSNAVEDALDKLVEGARIDGSTS